jgi:NAD+ synthase (glutamine-hydrolysing)
VKIHLHQTSQQIADFDSIFEYLYQAMEKKEDGLHLFPELFLTGYPLKDLCFQKPFITSYLTLLAKIGQISSKMKKREDECYLLGGLHYTFSKEEGSHPFQIQNVIFQLIPGEELTVIYSKTVLPNYDIFDEKKYFTPGDSPKIIGFAGHHIGLTICEDIWPHSSHHYRPDCELKKLMDSSGIKLDLVINLSASPFTLNKHLMRTERVEQLSLYLKAPVAYVNRVGGEDEILFDGHSFVYNGKEITHQLALFQPDTCTFELAAIKSEFSKKDAPMPAIEDEVDLSQTLSVLNSSAPTLKELSERNCHDITLALTFALREYADKCGFKSFLVALSGGLDSALVLTIAKMALRPGEHLEAIFMPGVYSSGLSSDLSEELCTNLSIPLTRLPIKFLHSVTRNVMKECYSEELVGIADENVQSRLRSMLLYTRSNTSNAMVINTSNKSELAVGYSTQYGDSVGALSLLGDLYKSEIFDLSRYINQKYQNIIPPAIIERPPTAELRDGQQDDHSLLPYPKLDAILEGILSDHLDLNNFDKFGFNHDEVEMVLKLFKRSEYKRFQFCPIVKLKSKSFGFGHRVPITSF